MVQHLDVTSCGRAMTSTEEGTAVSSGRGGNDSLGGVEKASVSEAGNAVVDISGGRLQSSKGLTEAERDSENQSTQSFGVLQLFARNNQPKSGGHQTFSRLEHSLLIRKDAVALVDVKQSSSGSATTILQQPASGFLYLKRLAIRHFALTYIAPAISHLVNLEELHLSCNRIQQVPPEIGALPQLRVLLLSSNKIVSPLPLEMEKLVSLETLDFSHNKLTSLLPLDLSKLASLTSLNLEFNDLQGEISMPSWLSCNLEGNESISNDSFGLEFFQGLPDKESLASDDSIAEVEHNHDSGSLFVDKQMANSEDEQVVEEVRELSPVRKRDRSEELALDIWEEDAMIEREADNCESDKNLDEGDRGEAPQVLELDLAVDIIDDTDAADTDVLVEIEPQGRKESGEALESEIDSEVLCSDSSEDEACSLEREEPEAERSKDTVRLGRKHAWRQDRNPKPFKRRRAVLESSPLSEKYHRESLCGVEDRLHDGFYDPGRERPFRSLEDFEKEKLDLHSREVIVVDRAQDEDLDLIASSARNLLTNLNTSASCTAEHSARALALFVSDCFGGSDRSDDLLRFRRTTLGLTQRGSNLSLSSCKSLAAEALAVLPGLRALCEEAVRFVKLRRGSNVVPIGALPVGICRHRAILFKYLCDRARPSIPCELVRGFLDYEPHAWNVVILEGERRLLVDACRPGRIQFEGEGDSSVWYLPTKRLEIDDWLTEEDALDLQQGTSSLVESIVVHEEIGRGASSAVVRRCTLGPITMAVKVIPQGASSGGFNDFSTGQKVTTPAPQGLSELRTLYSLGPHPCIVRILGHHIRTPHELLIFLEHIQSGSLETLLRRRSDQGLEAPLPPPLAVRIALELAKALEFVHAQEIIHRDVKSANVLVELAPSGKPRVLLCDFSSAVHEGTSSSDRGVKSALGGNPPADVCVGTPRWMAPDVLRAMYGRHPYGREADIWSFGCVVLEMLTLAIPYAGFTEAQVHARIQIGRRPDLPSDLQHYRPKLVHYSLEDLLETDASDDEEALCLRVLVGTFHACTNGDAALRPSASHIVSVLQKLATKLDEQRDGIVESDEVGIENDTKKERQENSQLSLQNQNEDEVVCQNAPKGEIAEELIDKKEADASSSSFS